MSNNSIQTDIHTAANIANQISEIAGVDPEVKAAIDTASAIGNIFGELSNL
jgi:hypothetical protein